MTQTIEPPLYSKEPEEPEESPTKFGPPGPIKTLRVGKNDGRELTPSEIRRANVPACMSAAGVNCREGCRNLRNFNYGEEKKERPSEERLCERVNPSCVIEVEVTEDRMPVINGVPIKVLPENNRIVVNGIHLDLGRIWWDYYL